MRPWQSKSIYEQQIARISCYYCYFLFCKIAFKGNYQHQYLNIEKERSYFHVYICVCVWQTEGKREVKEGGEYLGRKPKKKRNVMTDDWKDKLDKLRIFEYQILEVFFPQITKRPPRLWRALGWPSWLRLLCTDCMSMQCPQIRHRHLTLRSLPCWAVSILSFPNLNRFLKLKGSVD